jgi:hypothetical protein
MKKILLVTAAILITSLAYPQAFTFGPLAGFNASKLTTDIPELSQEAKAHFLFGAFARVGKKFYVQPELVYTVKGGLSREDDIPGAETNIKLNQLEVPLMVGYKLINLEVINLRAMAGPVMGFITDKEINPNDKVQDPIDSEWFKDTQWGLQLGAGIDILFLTIDIRYEFGLNNMYNPPAGQEEFDVKNNLWRVSVGWLIL